MNFHLVTLTVLPPLIADVQSPESHKFSRTIPRKFSLNYNSAISLIRSALDIP